MKPLCNTSHCTDNRELQEHCFHELQLIKTILHTVNKIKLGLIFAFQGLSVKIKVMNAGSNK